MSRPRPQSTLEGGVWERVLICHRLGWRLSLHGKPTAAIFRSATFAASAPSHLPAVVDVWRILMLSDGRPQLRPLTNPSFVNGYPRTRRRAMAYVEEGAIATGLAELSREETLRRAGGPFVTVVRAAVFVSSATITIPSAESEAS